MMGVGIGKAFAPSIDVITAPQLPPFYTAWQHCHPPVHIYVINEKSARKGTPSRETRRKNGSTTFKSDGSDHIYSDHIYWDDAWISMVWHMFCLANAHQSP